MKKTHSHRRGRREGGGVFLGAPGGARH